MTEHRSTQYTEYSALFNDMLRGAPDRSSFDLDGFAERLGVEPNTIPRYVAQGSGPRPSFIDNGRPRWSYDDLDEWYGSVHDGHAAYASLSTLGESELAAHGGYVCPAGSSHIGMRRPGFLALCREDRTGKFASIFRVEWMYTESPMMLEDFIVRENAPAPSFDWHSVKGPRNEGGGNHALVFFKLDLESEQRVSLVNRPRRGGSVWMSSLLHAVESGNPIEKFGYGIAKLAK